MSGPDKKDLDVEVGVKELEGGQVELSVRVSPEPVKAVRDRVVKAFGRRANIPGFRKGKAPRSVLERHIDEAALKEQVVETLVPDAYDAALKKVGLKPLDRARIGEAEVTEEGALTFSATVTRRPEMELGEYKGLAATRRMTRVTNAHVESELERVRSRRAEFRDLGAGVQIETGDVVVVDYEMFVEGERREEAAASGYPLEVGADQLFPELNEALRGKRVGDTVEVGVAYPEDHSDSSLAGKTAQFRVTVKEARRRQMPELSDDFAKQVSELDTVEALRTRIRENLEAMGGAVADQEVREELVRQVSDASSLDVPEAVVDREVDRRIANITEELDRRGLTLEQHLRNVGRTSEDWRADIEAEARQVARRALVLDEIGEREGIKVGEEEIHEEIHRRAGAEGVSEEAMQERLSDGSEFNRLVTRIYQRKVVDLLVENAEVAEEVVEPESEEEPGTPEGPQEGEGPARES